MSNTIRKIGNTVLPASKPEPQFKTGDVVKVQSTGVLRVVVDHIGYRSHGGGEFIPVYHTARRRKDGQPYQIDVNSPACRFRNWHAEDQLIKTT